MITKAITTCLANARQKNWDRTFWAFDIHGTILKPNHRRDSIATEFYPMAKEVMQFLTQRKDIVRILYTCSYPDEIVQYLAFFKAHGIEFRYVNENPEIANGGYGYYQDKFYFNVLMDDKAGFDGETDWIAIKETLQVNG